jgi:DNA-binding MarR family transcriptional regulator
MLSLLDWPKTTGQVALACGLSAAHASRAIRELMSRGLLESATPEVRGRGHLYALTGLGQEVVEGLNWDSSLLRTPMVRGTHPKAWYVVLVSRFGKEDATSVIRDLNLISVIDSPSRRWIPLRSQMRLLDEVEKRFGDGTYGLVRELAGDAVRHYSSVRRYLFRAIPWRLVLDTGGAVYLREFNHGRVEVETYGTGAVAKHYDWLSSPSRCVAWQGSWEGLLRMRNLQGEVEKRECILRGDDFCGYLLKWDE